MHQLALALLVLALVVLPAVAVVVLLVLAVEADRLGFDFLLGALAVDNCNTDSPPRSHCSVLYGQRNHVVGRQHHHRRRRHTMEVHVLAAVAVHDVDNTHLAHNRLGSFVVVSWCNCTDTCIAEWWAPRTTEQSVDALVASSLAEPAGADAEPARHVVVAMARAVDYHLVVRIAVVAEPRSAAVVEVVLAVTVAVSVAPAVMAAGSAVVAAVLALIEAACFLSSPFGHTLTEHSR